MLDDSEDEEGGYGGYTVSRKRVDRSSNNEIDGITVYITGERSRHDPTVTFHTHENNAFVDNIEGIRGKEIMHIGQIMATAEEAVSDVPNVDSVSSFVDKIVEYDPKRDQE